MRVALADNNAFGVREAWRRLSPDERGHTLAVACEFRQQEMVTLMLGMMVEWPSSKTVDNTLIVAVQKNEYVLIQRMVEAGLTGQAEAALVAAMAYHDTTSIALLAPVAPRLEAVSNLMENDYDEVYHLSYEQALEGVDHLAPHLTEPERQTLLKTYERDLLVQIGAAQLATRRAEAAQTKPATPHQKMRPRA